MDPQLTEDGKPYAPVRYKEIVQERYLISKYTNSSYTDIGEMTPTERNYILQFIKDDIERDTQIKKDLFNNNTQ